MNAEEQLASALLLLLVLVKLFREVKAGRLTPPLQRPASLPRTTTYTCIVAPHSDARAWFVVEYSRPSHEREPSGGHPECACLPTQRRSSRCSH